MAGLQLREFLEEMAKRRFDWAECNCFTICADWVMNTTGRDPAAKWRYIKTKAQARRIVREAGGDILLAEKAMAAFGARLISVPKCGDIALVRAPSAKRGRKIIQRPVGAICVDSNQFAVLTADLGLVIAPLPLIRAWSLDLG